MLLIYLFAIIVFFLLALGFFFNAAKRPKFVLYFSIVMSIVWPSYMVIKISSLPGISISRLMLVVLICLWILKLLSNPSSLSRYKNYQDQITILLGYFMWLIFSSILASNNKTQSLMSTANWFFNGPFVFFFILWFITNKRDINTLLYCMFFAFVFCNLLGLIEVYISKPLFGDLLLTETEFTENATEAKLRGGAYRIQSVFTNPLVYAQFLLISLTTTFYLKGVNKNFVMSCVMNVNIGTSLFLLYFTGSRAGLILGLGLPLVSQYIKLYQKNNQISKRILQITNFVIIPISAILLVYYIVQNVDEANNLHYLFVNEMVDQETTSNLARILQLSKGAVAFINQPILGYGMGQALVPMDPLNSIDNYYLTMILATGGVGLLILVCFIVSIFNVGKKNILLYEDKQSSFFLTSIVLILIFYLILSISKANLLFYIFSALLLVRRTILTSSEQENA